MRRRGPTTLWLDLLPGNKPVIAVIRKPSQNGAAVEMFPRDVGSWPIRDRFSATNEPFTRTLQSQLWWGPPMSTDDPKPPLVTGRFRAVCSFGLSQRIRVARAT
jgi:hypothetical protein